MTKERIEIIRQSVIPFVKKELLDIDYEGLGVSDGEEFEKDLNEVLDLAIKALGQPTMYKAMIHTLVKENDELKAEIGRLRQALEQQPSEDLINLVSEQEKWLDSAGYNAYNVDIAFKSIVKAIQNVHISSTSDDCVSRKFMEIWNYPKNELPREGKLVKVLIEADYELHEYNGFYSEGRWYRPDIIQDKKLIDLYNDCLAWREITDAEDLSEALAVLKENHIVKTNEEMINLFKHYQELVLKSGNDKV